MGSSIPVGTIVFKGDKQGVVVWPTPNVPYAPEANDIATYVYWKDGTVDWVYTCCLETV